MEERKRKVFPRRGVIDLPSRQINDFFTYLGPLIIDCLHHPLIPELKYKFFYDNLFLRCLICNAKIARVKNNRCGGGESPEGGGGSSIPVHVRGRTTNIMTRSSPGDILPRRLPTSVSGYSLCPTTSTPPGAAGEVSDTSQETSHRYFKSYCLLFPDPNGK